MARSAGKIARPDRLLTNREATCLRWLAHGLSPVQVAALLRISPATVDTHLRKALLKLDAPTATLAIVKALRHGLIHL